VKRAGFALIEIPVVIVVIAILASLVAPQHLITATRPLNPVA
jgi:prepilin-type N-terminal cleavage/methylation domain-containing protein